MDEGGVGMSEGGMIKGPMFKRIQRGPWVVMYGDRQLRAPQTTERDGLTTMVILETQPCASSLACFPECFIKYCTWHVEKEMYALCYVSFQPDLFKCLHC